MSWQNIHVGDYGWLGRLQVTQDGQPVDIRLYTTLLWIIRKPDGTLMDRTPLFRTDGQDGYLQYVFLDGDIDQVGSYSLWARVSKADSELTSNAITFSAKERPDDLQAP